MKASKYIVTTALWLVLAAVPALAASPESTSMLTLPGFNTVEGSSALLVATESRAMVNIRTTGLEDGYVYTLWSASFSNPENCVDGCGGDDAELRALETGFVMQQVGGHATGNGGILNLGGSVEVVNAESAEFHIVVANHGPLDPAGLPNEFRTPGPGVQIAFFLP